MIQRRLRLPRGYRHADAFDYIIVNDDFDHALQDLVAVTRSTRLASARQMKRYTALFEEFRNI